MLTIKDKTIFADDGTMLKVIDCPKEVSGSELTKTSDFEFHCSGCKKKVVATDFLCEEQIVEMLSESPETCLKISCFDPRFRFEL